MLHPIKRNVLNYILLNLKERLVCNKFLVPQIQVCVCCLHFCVKRRNKHLKEVVSLSAELQRVSYDEQKVRKDVEQKEKRTWKIKEIVRKTSDKLSNMKRKLQRVNTELFDYDEALKTKEQQLRERWTKTRISSNCCID